MNRKFNRLELATGFLMGFIPAFVLQAAFFFSRNAICHWRGCRVIDLDWWMPFPFPMLIGIIMAFTIASLHLEDY